MVESLRPAPAIEPALQPFYDGLREGRLLLAHCRACKRFDLPGVRTCPECLSHDLRWRRSAGRGTVFSFVVFQRQLHPAFDVPYAVCVVELDEGPRLVAALTGVDPAAIETGMPVTAVFGDDADGDGLIPIRFRRLRRSNRTPKERRTA